METSKIYKKYTIVSVVLILYAILIITLLVWVFKDHAISSSIDNLQSPYIIILAVVISVLTFTVSSAVFSAIGKSKNNTPLGMPDGSIRALIAFALITLFFILATQIYSKVSSGSVGKIERVSEDDLKELSVKDIIFRDKVDSLKNPSYDLAQKDSMKKGTLPPYKYYYNVTIKVATNSDASDMAKNIIASFTALIAAICGFYFGSAASKQVTDSKADTLPSSPKITPKSPIPTTGTKGTPMIFEWEVTPAGQLLIAEVLPDTSQPIADPGNPLKFTYTPSSTGKVTLKVHLKNNPSVMQEYLITISD